MKGQNESALRKAARSETSKLQVMQNQVLELHQELDDKRVRFQQVAHLTSC